MSDENGRPIYEEPVVLRHAMKVGHRGRGEEGEDSRGVSGSEGIGARQKWHVWTRGGERR